MKKKDLVAIIGVIIVSAIFSSVLSSKFLFTTKDREQKVEVILPISSTFNLPDKKIFNDKAVNPTKLIEIGLTTNDQPFAN